jgi:hypothetical protein
MEDNPKRPKYIDEYHDEYWRVEGLGPLAKVLRLWTEFR